MVLVMHLMMYQSIGNLKEKNKYKLIRTLKPKYNRCVLFDGKKFLHGQHVAGERYFHDEFRLNQAFFFCENP